MIFWGLAAVAFTGFVAWLWSLVRHASDEIMRASGWRATKDGP